MVVSILIRLIYLHFGRPLTDGMVGSLECFYRVCLHLKYFYKKVRLFTRVNHPVKVRRIFLNQKNSSLDE